MDILAEQLALSCAVEKFSVLCMKSKAKLLRKYFSELVTEETLSSPAHKAALAQIESSTGTKFYPDRTHIFEMESDLSKKIIFDFQSLTFSL